MRTPTTAKMIKELTMAIYGSAPNPREKYVLTQALHGLVRLAKAEQMLEIKKNVERAAATLAASGSRRETKAILRKVGMSCNTKQGQLEFDRDGGTRFK